MGQMRPWYSIMGLAIVAVGFLSGCDSDNEPSDGGVIYPRNDVQLTPQLTRACDNISDLTFRLFSEYLKADDLKENDAISPLSLWMALDMFQKIGTEQDQEDYINAINPQGTYEDVDNLNLRLLEELPNVDKSIDFSLSNSYWLDIFYTPDKKYLADIQKYYHADFFHIELQNSLEATRRINEWCSEKTNGLIKNILNESKPFEDSHALLNAMYFKGDWAKKATLSDEKVNFTNADGSISSIRMMEHTHFARMTMDGREVVYIPFGNGGYGFYAILPLPDETIEECADYLTTQSLDDIIRLSDRKIEDLGSYYSFKVNLPTFEIEKAFDTLSEVVPNMGIPIGITDDKFGKRSPAIRQKTYFKADENGAKAAAVTMVSVSIGTSGKTDTVFDRPFIFMIAEKSTNAVMIIGDVRKL